MKDCKYTISLLIAAALAVVIGLLTSCTVTTNYYMVYPTKVERIECPQQIIQPFDWGITPNESIDPGFYKPVLTLTPYELEPGELLNGWLIGDTLLRTDPNLVFDIDTSYSATDYTLINPEKCEHNMYTATTLGSTGKNANTCTCLSCGKQWKCN